MSANDRGIHNGKLWNSYSLCISYPSLTPVNLPPRWVTRYTMLTGIMCNYKKIEQLLFTE